MSEMQLARAGEQLQLSARTFNALVAGELRDRAELGTIDDTRSPKQKSPVIVQIAWTGEEPVELGRVVKLGDVLLEPATDEWAPLSGLKFFASEFSGDDSDAPYAITMEPIAAPEGAAYNLGFAIIPGAYWAKVNVVDEDHTHATPPASGTLLTSSPTGLKIVWKESGTGEKWGVIWLASSTPSLRVLKGSTTTAVLNTNSTFSLVDLSVISGQAPDEPLTVQNTFAVGYASGEFVLAFEQADGTWTNTPYYGRVYASIYDTFPETLWYKLWEHGTYNSETHQLVYFEEFDAVEEIHGPPVPRVLVRAFTAKGTGGSASYAEGYCVEIEDLETDKLHLNQITTAAGVQAVDFSSSVFQLWFHDVGATARDDAKWLSFAGYEDNENQLWWHKSGAFVFETTTDYGGSATEPQLLINWGAGNGGDWQWKSAADYAVDAPTQLLVNFEDTWKWKTIADYDAAKVQIPLNEVGVWKWKEVEEVEFFALDKDDPIEFFIDSEDAIKIILHGKKVKSWVEVTDPDAEVEVSLSAFLCGEDDEEV